MFLLAFANLYIIIQKSGVQIINHIIIPEKKHENGDNINAEKEFRHFPWIIKLIGLFGWGVPGADPKSYDEYGALKRTRNADRDER